jgi:hypothetical protein
MRLKTYQSVIFSLLAPILIVFLGVQSSYWFDLRANLSAVEITYSLLAVTVGGYIFNHVKIISIPKRLIAWFTYVLAVAITIFWVSLFTACTNGDCL